MKNPEVLDTAIMKKKHPCGGQAWRILMVGTDIKLKCLTCNRIIMLDRETFNKRVKDIITPKEGL